MSETNFNENAKTEIIPTDNTGEQQNEISVPYLAYESAQVRAERKEKRLIGIIVLLIVLLAACNALWLYEWMSYDYVSETTTYEQGGGGFNNLNTGTQGDVTDEPENDNEKNIEDETQE